MGDNVFVFSSFLVIPERFFNGYCFVGDDFILGMEGAKKYYEEKNQSIEPGNDGCYISIETSKKQTTIGSDFCGYKKIFYYHKNGIWAISNSILRLAEHLKENNVQLKINPNQLVNAQLNGSFGEQLTTFDTIFSDIFLLPSFNQIIIENKELKITKVNRQRIKNYKASLEVFLNTWVNRIETLIKSGIFLMQADLTGGRDSRAIFSIFHRAISRLNSSENLPVIFNSGTSEKFFHDFRVAEKICKHYNYSVNEKKNFFRLPLSARDSYELWKYLNLGTYRPVYFTNYVNSTAIQVTGGGGENHRPFYPSVEPSQYADQVSKRVDLDFLRQGWKAEFMSTIDNLIDACDDDIDPMILHYREFRNRCHAGRSPQYRTTVVPLGSHLLQNCSDDIDKKLLEQNQIHYDIMENLCPGLMSFEYDKEDKLPTRKNIKSICKVRINEEQSSGKVYLDNSIFSNTGSIKKEGITRIEMLYEEYKKYREYIPENIFSKEFYDEAESTILKALKNNSFGHASDIKPISSIILIGSVFNMISS